MARKSPYSFPARSKKAMVAYLGEHFGYHPMNSNNGGFVLAWNVKIHHLDSSGKADQIDCPVHDRFDAQWAAHVESDHDLFWEACTSAARMYIDGEWTNFPGIEQGEWKFYMNGRSNGYMILDEAPAWLPAPRAWRMSPMIWESRSAYRDWLAELDAKTLKQFYRAICVLDHDLRREAAESEVAYQLSFMRSQWEEDLIAAENCDVAKQEASRADMYSR